jgi:hypothetical protein
MHTRIERISLTFYLTAHHCFGDLHLHFSSLVLRFIQTQWQFFWGENELPPAMLINKIGWKEYSV